MDNVDDDRRVMMNKLRVEVDSSSSDGSDREEDDAPREAPPPVAWSHQPAAAGGIGNNRKRLLTKQLSMKETTREIKWEKRRRQILRRSSMVSIAGAGQMNGEGKNPVLDDEHHQVRPSSARCLTDEDLDELRGSFELGFGFDEETGGANLRDTLPALDFYFAVNRQLSDPKLKTLAASPTSTLSAVSSSSTLVPDSPSPRSPNASSTADAWKIFSPGDHPQLVKTRLRHWAQVVACSVKHGC
ncbi:hypothetical protein EJB05_21751 [Eragrostis curvula]|uniref:Uncharacterized protein n=1 Tax=Eragrostis curvula TaxID=38414 RepID=A0A5J9V2B0_9POAL|nr:hypothetical protein EJB05_21751 [Eragrostis curvula]